MFQRIRFLIFNWLKPWMNSVEAEFKNELARQANRKAVLDAVAIQRRYIDSMTPEKLEALRKQPPIGECSHLKGAGPYTNVEDERAGGNNLLRIKDYALDFFTFADCTQRIRCQRCGEVAWNRYGEKTPNWATFLKMFQESSTNTAACSEITAEMLSKYGQFLEGGQPREYFGQTVAVYGEKMPDALN